LVRLGFALLVEMHVRGVLALSDPAPLRQHPPVHGVPPDLPLDPLVGEALQQIGLGQWQIILHFPSGTISIEGGYRTSSSTRQECSPSRSVHSIGSRSTTTLTSMRASRSPSVTIQASTSDPTEHGAGEQPSSSSNQPPLQPEHIDQPRADTFPRERG
jgi:hypothetical protein